MKLSIRTKILGGYSFVIILFFAIILNSIFSQRGVRKKLLVINEDYLPKLKLVTNLANYNHLEDSFEVKKIVEEKSNKLFIQSVRIYHPRLFENHLEEITKSIKKSQARVEDKLESRLLMLVLKSIEEVKAQHDDYKTIISAVYSNVENAKVQQASDINSKLLRKKRILKSEISFLRKRLDNNIRSGLLKISRIEKQTSIITTVLSLLAILIAGVITLVALFTLAPIRKLIAGVKKVSEGDYNHRVDIKTEGEMKTLAHEFNNMSRSILERNNKLKEQQKKLIQSERMAVIGRMASHITHEVKNPLNSISLNTELLEDELKGPAKSGDTKEAFTVLKSIKKEIERLSTISEEYLSYARMPKGEKSSTDVNQIIKDLTSLLKSEMSKKGIVLEEKYAVDLSLVKADINQIKQSFLNILKNAIEAMDSGGKITISTRNESNNVVAIFSDDGPGISRESLENIFDPFFSTKEKGTGLGLSLTQKIIREQNGEIRCESEPSRGTSFIITIPCFRDDKRIDANP